MTEPEWVNLDSGHTVADEAWWFAQQGDNGDGPDFGHWDVLRLDTVEDEPSEEPNLGGLGIVYRGKRHVFSGPQESAKTLLAYAVGIAVVRSGQPIVVIDFEMGRLDTKRRFRELGASDVELAMTYYVEPDTPPAPDTVRGLVGLEPGLVIIDAAAGAYALSGLDDNKRQDVERFAQSYVVPFWRARVATIVLDHVVKTSKERGSYAIGSERKVGGADVHLGFDVVHPIKRGAHGVYRITTHKDRMGFLKRGKLGELKLTSDPETHAISWQLEAAVETDAEHKFRPTTLMEKVSIHLERADEPLSRNMVVQAGFGKTDYVRTALDILVDEGFVTEASGARGSRLFESVRPFREAWDADFAPTSPHFAPSGGASHFAPSPHPLQGGEVQGEAKTGDVTSPLPPDDGISF